MTRPYAYRNHIVWTDPWLIVANKYVSYWRCHSGAIFSMFKQEILSHNNMISYNNKRNNSFSRTFGASFIVDYKASFISRTVYPTLTIIF